MNKFVPIFLVVAFGVLGKLIPSSSSSYNLDYIINEKWILKGSYIQYDVNTCY